MSQWPKISVCMPAYNHAMHLPRAVGSVLAQAGGDFELIVCDDASSDNTGTWLSRIDDPRVRVVRHRRNAGIPKSRNACLDLARGEYIAWLDADDMYLRDALLQLRSILDANPRVGLVHGAFEIIDCEGARMRDWPLPFSTDCIEPGSAAFGELALSNYINNSTVMIRRRCYDEAGSYWNRLSTAEDWEMWMRSALRWDIAYTATPIAQYRQHASNTTRLHQVSRQYSCDCRAIRRVLSTQRKRIHDVPTIRRRAYLALSLKALVLSGDFLSGRRRMMAARAALVGLRYAGGIFTACQKKELLTSIMTGNEYQHYHVLTSMYDNIVHQLPGTRFAERMSPLGQVDESWQRELNTIATTMRNMIPSQARVAVVDKWDPTLLHLSRRRGWHFPHRRLHPGGYPRDSKGAIAHLEQLRQRRAQYLVFPSASFWWLEFYREFHEHLETLYSRIWSDEHCIIFHLVKRGEHVLPKDSAKAASPGWLWHKLSMRNGSGIPSDPETVRS